MRPHVRMDSDSWCSPPVVADPLEQFYDGPCDVDPCSNGNSIIKSRVAFTAGGLHLPWRLKRPVNHTGYENPPYSKGSLWAPKAVTELVLGHLEEHVRLVMVSTSTEWWGQQCGVVPTFVLGKPRCPRNPRIMFTKRLKFIGDQTFGARFDTALVYYGRRTRQFEKEFGHLARWLTWGR